jgi:hypothetical protein
MARERWRPDWERIGTRVCYVRPGPPARRRILSSTEFDRVKNQILVK